MVNRRILAWKSEETRENSGSIGSPYQDRPVRKPYWEKVDDHPVPGLSWFIIPEDPSQ